MLIKQIIEFWIEGALAPSRACTPKQGLQEGGSGGTSYPGPGLGGPELKGPGTVQVSALSFGITP